MSQWWRERNQFIYQRIVECFVQDCSVYLCDISLKFVFILKCAGTFAIEDLPLSYSHYYLHLCLTTIVVVEVDK